MKAEIRTEKIYSSQVEELEESLNHLKQENEKLNKMTGIFSARLCKKYEQTLQEIKEIAEMAINGGYATKSSDYSEGMEQIGHYVIEKLTKAEGKE